MFKLLFSLLLLLSLYQGAFALDIVSSPSDTFKGYDQHGFHLTKTIYGYALGQPIYGYDLKDYNNNNVTLTGQTQPYYGYDGGFYANDTFSIFSNFAFYRFYYSNSSNIVFDYTIIGKPNSNQVLYMTGMFFFDGLNSIIKINGANLDFYSLDVNTMTVGTVIQSLNMVNTFGHNISIKGGTISVFIKISSSLNGFLYQGTDGKNYIIDENFSVDSPYNSVFDNALPLGPIGYNGAILAGTTSGSGSYFFDNVMSTGGTTILLDTSYILKGFNTFENPKAYFTTSTDSVVSWDMNCVTQGYDSCRLNGGTFKCTNNSGSLSPNSELCGGEVYVGPPPSCTDNIKNQNETGIDFGGVCGGTETYTIDSPYGGKFLCSNVPVYYPPTTGSGYNFGQLSGYTEDNYYQNTWTFDFFSGSTDEDYFEAFGLGTGSLIYSGSLKSLNAGVTSTLISRDGGQYTLNMDIFSIRSDSFRKAGYIAFKTGKNTQNQGNVTFIDESGAEQRKILVGVGGGIAIAYTTGDFIAKEIKITGLASPFVFSGMEIGGTSQGYNEVAQCENGSWSCAVGGSSGNMCSPQYYPGNPRGSCGFVDDICQPTTDLPDSDFSGLGTGTGGTGNFSSSGTSFGSGINSNFSFSLGQMEGVGSGTDCSEMFDGLNFLYGDSQSSIMTMNLSNNFTLADTPWSCSFLGADVCLVAYDSVDYIVLKFFTLLDGTVNTILGPFKSAVGYFGEPIAGQQYCFMGDKYTYEGKIQEYYSYSERATVQVGGQKTGFDYIFLLLITVAIAIFIFK